MLESNTLDTAPKVFSVLFLGLYSMANVKLQFFVLFYHHFCTYREKEKRGKFCLVTTVVFIFSFLLFKNRFCWLKILITLLRMSHLFHLLSAQTFLENFFFFNQKGYLVFLADTVVPKSIGCKVTWQSLREDITEYVWKLSHAVAQSAGAIEYTDCFSAEG